MDGLTQQTAGVSPILTKYMVEYVQRQEQYAARYVFPYVQTPFDVGTIYADDADNSMRYEDPEWGRKKGATEVDIKLGNVTFTVHPRAYKTLVTAADRRNFQGPFGVEQFAIRKLGNKFLVAREVKAEAQLRTSTVIQSQAGGTAWNAASLDPIKDFQTTNVKIIKAIGQVVNKMLIPPAVWDARFMTNAANTAGKQMRDQLGYVIAMTGDVVTPTLAGKWFGVQQCIVPAAVKAGGNQTSTPASGGNTAGGYIWSDTTQVYIWYGEDTPDLGTSSYGISPGPQDIQNDQPFFDWDRNGDWYRTSCIFGEFEAVGKAAAKITGL